MTEDLAARVDALMPEARQGLERLVRIPSVSAEGFDPSHVRRSAEATAELLGAAGFGDVGLLEVEGAHPAVLARAEGPAGAPRVLLYAHHDVQPEGDYREWTTPPYEPVERGGRLFGRGTSDDKCGILCHAAAFRAHDGNPPVGVSVFVEGEEEIGSPTLSSFLERYRDLLSADVIVLADSDTWELGTPALTTSLRGVINCVVEVRTLEHGVHSGLFGGALPDALTVLCRLLATLHDERGRVAVAGLTTSEPHELDMTEERLRREGAALEGVELLGEGSLTSRLWSKPAISVIGIDGPRVAEASNTLVPRAQAKVSMRVAPGDDPDRAMAALKAHLERKVPWGARVQVEAGAAGHPHAIRAEGLAFDAARAALTEAWGVDTVEMGMGGSIPFLHAFGQTFPEAALIVTGVADSDCSAHGPDESVDLEEFRRGCLAEALLLHRLAPDRNSSPD